MAVHLTPFQIDDALRRIALPQLGLVTVEQAARAGVSKWALDRRRRSGLWTPVHPGVLRSGAVAPNAEQRMLAAALAVRGSTLIGPSSALVDGLPVGPRGAAVPVVAVGPGRSTRTAGVEVVRLTVELPVRRWHGVPVTTPAATLVTLPRFASADRLERCLDHCLVNRLTTVDRVRALVEALPSRAVPGRRRLLELLADRAERGIGHRSGTEQTVRDWLDSAGLVGWRPNVLVPVPVGPPIECDFVWADRQTILEVSPFHTHGTKAAQERDVERRRLLVEAGWSIVEASDVDIASERAFARVVQSLRTILGRRSA
jgi:very-short-patch-repair endonuclease